MVTLFNCLRPCQIALADTPTCDVLRSQFLHMAFTYEGYFCWIQNPSRQFFFFLFFQVVHPLSSCVHYFWCEFSVFLPLFSVYSVFFFFPGCFSDFSFLFLVYINLIIMCLGGWVSRCVCVCVFILLWVHWVSRICVSKWEYLGSFFLKYFSCPHQPTQIWWIIWYCLAGHWVYGSHFPDSHLSSASWLYTEHCGAILGSVCILLLSFKEFGVLSTVKLWISLMLWRLILKIC